MATEIRFGKPSEREELLDFINYVFGFNGISSDFLTLIPHYFQPEGQPAEQSLMLLEDGKLRAVVGTFCHELRVCDDSLKVLWIGNVAVHPRRRGAGYMKQLMQRAIDHAKSINADFMALGGHRHRYLHFTFDKIGSEVLLSLADHTMRRCFGDCRTSRLALREVTEQDTDLLRRILLDYESKPVHALRPASRLHVYLTSQHNRLFALTEQGEYRGYALVDNDHIKEFHLDSPDLTSDFLIAIFDGLHLRALHLHLPPYAQAEIAHLQPYWERYSLDSVRSISVLCYRSVLQAYLKLRLATEPLPNGSLSLEINGANGVERLRVTVENGNCEVLPCSPSECALTLEHSEAMSLLFSPYCPLRSTLPFHARLWFPLPFWIDHPEHF